LDFHGRSKMDGSGVVTDRALPSGKAGPYE
jgi:hypothetical protein